MNSIKRLVSISAVAILAASVSGCVVRPLWWGHQGNYGRDRSDGYSDRDGGDRDHGDRGDRGGRDDRPRRP